MHSPTRRDSRLNVAIANAGLRTIGLGSRFLLAMFMARFMTLQDVGTFALLAGAAGLLPPVAGFGLNYFMARHIIGISHEAAAETVRERISISILAGALCSAFLFLLVQRDVIQLPFSPWLAIGILMLELLGLDLQVALLARSRSTFANLQLFFRNGAWVAPFMILAWAIPEYRSMETLAWFWFGGLVVSHLLMLGRYASDYRAAVRISPRTRQPFAASVGSRAAKIYLSDLGLAGSVYLDRFIISSLDGVDSAGIYFFYASIVNSAYIICLAATVQVYQPQLRAAFLQGGVAGLGTALRQRFRITALVTAGALIATGPAAYMAAHISRNSEIMAAVDIVPVLLAAYGVKMMSDFMSTALAAAEKDLHYALFNVLGLLLTVLGCVIAIPVMGIVGAAFSVLIASMILLVIRFASWRRMEAEAHRGKAMV